MAASPAATGARRRAAAAACGQIPQLRRLSGRGAVAVAAGEAFDQAQEGDCHEQVLIASDEAEQAQARQRRRLSGHCHSGMGRAALFLGAKFGPLLRPLYAQGLRVTLVGHSLGAGGLGRLAAGLAGWGAAAAVHAWAWWPRSRPALEPRGCLPPALPASPPSGSPARRRGLAAGCVPAQPRAGR